MLENCVYCGGFAHDTPGKYKGYPCGFCNGRGLVEPESNWVKSQPVIQHRHRSKLKDNLLTLISIAVLAWGIGYILFI
jgi:hypothetical protein